MKRNYFFIISLITTAIISLSVSQAQEIQNKGFDRARIELLKARILDRTFKDINSILVMKKGRILIEEYFNGEGPDTLHDIRSAGKSFTSALVGIAIDKGFIKGIDEKLLSFYPEIKCQDGWDPVKKNITLQHVLTMSFGFAEPGAYPAWENRNWYTLSWKSDILCQPIAYEPGSRFDYDSAAPALFGPIIERSTGYTVGEFAETFLFMPLGIKRYKWHTMRDGKDYTGGGFRTTPGDMARFGQLYLQKGSWKGKQLVSKKWVEESTRPHLVANEGLDVSYGYYWWREIFLIGNRQIRVFSASGNGGNKIYVFPTEDLVVTITASAYNQSYDHSQVRLMMSQYILPAVIQNSGSLPKGPVFKTVPETGFVISEIIFFVTLILCILWPLNALGWMRIPGKSQSGDGKENRKIFCRIWIGLNALAVMFFVGVVLSEARALDVLLNCGYVQPVQSAVRKMIISWAIILLTAGSFVLSMKSWRVHNVSNFTRGWICMFTAVSMYCIFKLAYLGLLFFK